MTRGVIMAIRKKIKLNKALKGYPAGTILEIPFGANKQPIEKYWEERLKDATIDNCVEICKCEPKKEKTKEKSKKYDPEKSNTGSVPPPIRDPFKKKGLF